ncbi:unnamed protein product [Somion occarium]|uniref:RRM domain-containing protein n=1 Tax=Somion occarium TaxID=3059160 RepID=A0ABP1D1V2_9APHY
MSELDADLYGDLYGNDESEFAVPTEHVDEHAKKEEDRSEVPKQESPPPSTYTAIDTLSEDRKPSIADSIANQPQPIPAASSAMAPTSYTSQQATQQIPTYQERQEPEYSSEVAAMTSRPPSGYAGQLDRPVRPSEMKEEGKMFIGGLNWDTTDEGLRKYFSQFGKVEACTIMRDAAGRSRCFAFLTFEDPASVNAVMVREHFLDGKIIDPKRAIPRQEHQRATKLFIGGLAGSVTSESMREFFSQFGKVVDATVMLDRETGRSKGFGFVSFEAPFSA